ncbi:methyltransferase domain-containing protein [Burkholderia cepacia]|uniref:glycosyltransferase family protein n=1 Tax=Burkholderia cepacia TaxID=292 RepID=UPI00264F1A6A|nr:methyltransferase domain-containing protein [Burkholderia cepacia]MDN7440422.1 methyltransferase domain-containing protein [Burkholderia cepacia]
MSHPQQQAFCSAVKSRFPQFFQGVFALDIGSLDINGNNQFLFDADSLYLGIDVAEGRNVDLVCPAHELGLPPDTFDVVVSTECLEHDRYWDKTLRNAVRMLRPGGLLLITCATDGRPEHGTRRTTPHDAPLLAIADSEWADYYRNLTEADIRAALNIDETFSHVEFSTNDETHDLYFFGVKHGVLERTAERSIGLPSHPVRLLETNLRTQLQQSNEALASATMELQLLRSERSELMRSLDRQMDHVTQELSGVQARLHDLVTERSSALATQRDELSARLQHVSGEINRIYASRSWRITRPLRMLTAPLYRFKRVASRARNALRYVARGDFRGLQQRLDAVRMDRAIESHLNSGPPQTWGVMTTRHTLFIAHLIADRLRKHGWQVDIMTEAPPRFVHDMYVVVCPQMFKRLPPGERRIAFQMEQSVSSRWFTDDYLRILEGSLAVLEYSLKNIEFLDSKGIKYPHVHYLPVGASRDYQADIVAESLEKKWDLLFYGDAKSSPRRRQMLETLQKHFNVRICSEVFGDDVAREIRQARVVVNIHYYENALLEMPRIQECLSLGVPLVSESSSDQAEYPEIFEAVTFFDEGDEQDMLRAVQAALDRSYDAEAIARAVDNGSVRFSFMFDRFLTAMNFLPPTKLLDDGLPLPDGATRVVLSLPETIARRRIYEAAAAENCVVFDGVRLRPGWVGCGLSYSALARHAQRKGLHRLTVLEDDALLPEDFEKKIGIVNAYLDSKDGQWDVFSGLIAVLHPGTRVIGVEDFQGMRFVTIDKMTSTVCNIYSERALRMLAEWDSNDRNDQTNTIDRYLERQADLRVVVALPFLVGHREDVYSTLWGFQNTQYNDLIENSERELGRLAEAA